MTKKHRTLTLVALFIGIIAVAGFTMAPRPERPLNVSGTIETRNIRVGSRASGRIERVLVKEGNSVEARQILVILEGTNPGAPPLGAGVAKTVDVGDVQARLARARDNRVAALYRHNVARIELPDASSTIQTLVQDDAKIRDWR